MVVSCTSNAQSLPSPISCPTHSRSANRLLALQRYDLSRIDDDLLVGRELQLVAKLFSNEQTTTTLATVGPGGTGKSQLALEASYRTRQNSRSCLVFWMDASDIDSLYLSYASVAQKLSIPGCDDDQADITQVVKRCVAAISTRQCLLIYDNVEGTTLRYASLVCTARWSITLC